MGSMIIDKNYDAEASVKTFFSHLKGNNFNRDFVKTVDDILHDRDFWKYLDENNIDKQYEEWARYVPNYFYNVLTKILLSIDINPLNYFTYDIPMCCYIGVPVISMTIPAAIHVIREGAFEYVTELKSINTDDDCKLENIEAGAFEGCSELETVDLSKCEDFFEIEQHAFSQCKKLSKLILSNIVVIDNLAFAGCTNLKNIDYKGTIEDFKHATLYAAWNENSAIETITCSDGVINVEDLGVNL